MQFKRTTVEALAFQLPVGAEGPGGTRQRDFGYKAWRAKDERVLGQLREDNPRMTAGEFTAHVLGHFLTHWCGRSLEGMTDKERLVMLGQAWAGDVYHAWVQLRREAMGDKYPLAMSCPSATCREPFGYEVELGSVEVLEPEDNDTLRTPVQLRDGIPWQGQDRKLLTLQPLRWNTYMQIPTGGVNLGDLKLAIVKGSVVGVEGVEHDLVLPDSALDELTKHDLELLAHKIEDEQPGPSLLAVCPCPKCKAKVQRGISWAYDTFFSMGERGDSSRGAPQRSGDGKSSS